MDFTTRAGRAPPPSAEAFGVPSGRGGAAGVRQRASFPVAWAQTLGDTAMGRPARQNELGGRLLEAEIDSHEQRAT